MLLTEWLVPLLTVFLGLMAAVMAWKAKCACEEVTRRLEENASRNRSEMQNFVAVHLNGLREELRHGRLDQGARLDGISALVHERLEKIQAVSERRLEDIRHTVDGRLKATLETQIGESFRLVGERLEQVQRGLGEMQLLAQDVGGLKRVLSNVKVRGVLGEAQLGALLEQFLAPQQYGANVRVKPRSAEMVEYAVKLPGTEEGSSVWLPVDAKFPLEDYQRMQEALEAGDLVAAETSGKALEQRILSQARDIRDKYISPPTTTDFALLFLPFEGLFAETLRRPGLVERIARECRVHIVGPSTLVAFLNSLQVGFRTLAISKRSAEVWKLLASVKQEFGKFGEALQAADRKLDEAKLKLGHISERSRILGQRLSGIEIDHENEVKSME